MPFIIYTDLECLIEKLDRCKNNSENLSTPKVGEHITPGFSMSKVGGHCHFTGKYIDPAYSMPNLKYIVTKEFSTVFHNGL